MKQKPIEYDSGFTRHFILYSKGHYKHTSNVIKDLRTLMSNYSGADKGFYTDESIYTFVCESFVDSCTKNDIKRLLKCFYSKPFFLGEGQATLEEMVSHMIGMMACIQVYDVEGDNKIELVKLGEANPDYLPIPNPDEKSKVGSRR